MLAGKRLHYFVANLFRTLGPTCQILSESAIKFTENMTKHFDLLCDRHSVRQNTTFKFTKYVETLFR